ncbi:MAG: hypothetical protein HPY66_1601 [Firmicutes bacterium]|nr:hypothetical protein [Bacillota bacterium]
MKRLMAITLAVVMVLGVAATGYAAPNWKTDGGLPPGIQKQLTLAFFTSLKDLDDVPWAKNSMEKMAVKGIIKGYEDLTFKPNRSVTKLEAIVLALRIMGWEDKAVKTNVLPAKYKGSKVDQWAVGYIKVAYDKGILDEVDILDFNPNEAAKRWEVAKYFVRALGYEEEAQDHMKDRLKFKDYPAIPVGAVGYVYVINDLGLMVGNADGTFNPNKAVSRAEMAVLMDRIDGKVDSDVDENEVEGKIVDIDYDDYELTLEVDGEEEDYEALEGIAVYYNGSYISFDKLKEGNIVQVLLDSQGKIMFIELKDKTEDKLVSDYRGEVKAIDADDREITIKSGTAIFIFVVKSDADIEVNGEDADLEDVLEGDYVKLKVDDRNRVIKIQAEGERKGDDAAAEEVSGTIYAITTGSVRGITIRLDSGRIKTYNITSNTEIFLDGEDAALSELETGMKVVLEVEGNDALVVEAETEASGQVEGVIYRVNDDTIRVKVGSSYKTYTIDDDTVILLDGEESDVGDLMVDMNVKVRYRAELAVKIEAESLASEAEGVISEVGRNSIKVKVGSTTKTLTINSGTKVYIDGKAAAAGDLKVNMEVRVKFRAELALEIRASSVYTEVEGVITGKNASDSTITVKVGSRTRTYGVGGAEIYVEGVRARFSSLKLGMDVKLEIANGTSAVRVDAELDSVEGEVVSVDTDDMEITLEVYGSTEVYGLDDGVEVELDGEDAELEDIETGDDVELLFEDGVVVKIRG